MTWESGDHWEWVIQKSAKMRALQFIITLHKTPHHYVSYMDTCVTRINLIFQCATVKNWKEPGGKATLKDVSPTLCVLKMGVVTHACM